MLTIYGSSRILPRRDLMSRAHTLHNLNFTSFVQHTRTRTQYIRVQCSASRTGLVKHLITLYRRYTGSGPRWRPLVVGRELREFSQKFNHAHDFHVTWPTSTVSLAWLSCPPSLSCPLVHLSCPPVPLSPVPLSRAHQAIPLSLAGLARRSLSRTPAMLDYELRSICVVVSLVSALRVC
jgi:hypothetical protein